LFVIDVMTVKLSAIFYNSQTAVFLDTCPEKSFAFVTNVLQSNVTNEEDVSIPSSEKRDIYFLNIYCNVYC